MAYQPQEAKKHAFQQIQEDIKQNNMDNLLLFCGEEQYLVHWARDLLIGEYINQGSISMDYTKIDGESADFSRIKETCETLSMFSQKRILEISEFPLLWENEMKGFSQEAQKEFAEYLENIPETCILLFTGQNQDKKSKKKSKFYKTIEKCGTIYDFTPLNMKLLRSFIAKRFKLANLEIKPSVIDMIISESGYTNRDIDYGLFHLENDIKKIIAHSNGKEVIPSDVALTITDSLETNIFAMLDAISRNRKDEAYRLLHNLLLSGENVYKLLALITSQLELILQVKELREEGQNLKEIQKKLKVHEFRIKKAMSFTNRFSTENLKKILTEAYQIDNNIKTGLMEQTLALEFFIAEI